MPATIVLDFDGTIALGTGPILAFARVIAESVGTPQLAEKAAAAIASFEAGDATYRDGYDAVTSVAVAEGATAEQLSAAYEASRELLGTEDAAVTYPTDLPAFLDRIGTRARLVLATNAPRGRIIEVLTSWGIEQTFDAMHFTVGKPEGLVPVLREALASGPVLAVGDIAEFDLAPALELGADAALVGATAAHSTAAVTMRGATLADLYEQISGWVGAASPDSLSTAETSHPNERNTH